MATSGEAGKNVGCPVCGADEYEIWKEKANGLYRIVRCADCRLIYTNPMPLGDTKDSYHDVYDNWDYHDLFCKDPDRALQMALREMKRQTRFWRRRKLLPKGPGRLLDVGCGAGHILAAAGMQGWEAVGLEIDANSYKETAARWNLDIRPVFLAEAEFPENYFDWVRARYVFEHLPRPNEMLADIRRVLKPGGILTIDVPNQEGFFSRWRVRRGKMGGVGQKYGYLDPPIHVIGYSPRTMKMLLEKNGFETPYSFSTFPGSPTFRTECGLRGIKRGPYILGQWMLSLVDLGSICVSCGRKTLTSVASG